MTATVGKRIQSMIDHMGKGETALALSDVCIAIDITAQKYYNETHSSATCYKRFLKEHMWMIMATGMGSIVTSAIKIPFTHMNIRTDDQGYCTLEEIIYHVIRCNLIHGTGENSNIIWNNKVSLAIGPDGTLNLSPSFIWGFALCVIACPVNRDERVGDTCWISTVTFKYLINDLWGKRDSVKKMIQCQFGISV